MTGITESSQVLNTTYGGLFTTTQFDVSGNGSQYVQTDREHSDTIEEVTTELSNFLKKIGLYVGTTRTPGEVHSSFTSEQLGLLTDRTIIEQGVLVDTITSVHLKDGIVQGETQVQKHLSSPGSSLVGGLVSVADEFVQRVRMNPTRNID